MNRTLLFCLTLTLPQFVAAAPCDLLPYENQCQGSNLWPVPAGWAADNNGDCQPQPPANTSWWRPSPGQLQNEQPSPASWYPWSPAKTSARSSHNCAEMDIPSYAAVAGKWYVLSSQGWGGSVASGNSYSPWTLTGSVACDGVNKSVYAARASNQCPPNATGTENCRCASGYLRASGTTNQYLWSETCVSIGLLTKPSDGVCTARWTSSSQATLQKDPLDPDCDANSCVMDSVCKLS